MIFVKLQKHLKSGKLFVEKWYFVPKEKVTPDLCVVGEQMVLEEHTVPSGFYKNPTHFYLDELSRLRNGKFLL